MFFLWCWCAWQKKRAFISVEVCVFCVYSSRIGLFSSWESTFRWDGVLYVCVWDLGFGRRGCVDRWSVVTVCRGVDLTLVYRNKLGTRLSFNIQLSDWTSPPLRSNKLKSLMHHASPSPYIYLYVYLNLFVFKCIISYDFYTKCLILNPCVY